MNLGEKKSRTVYIYGEDQEYSLARALLSGQERLTVHTPNLIWSGAESWPLFLLNDTSVLIDEDFYLLDDKEMTHKYHHEIIIVKNNIQKKDLLFWYDKYINQVQNYRNL